MRELIFVSLFCLTTIVLSSQSDKSEISRGVVTFKAAENIYVRFLDTELIGIGDTLHYFINQEFSPCLEVTQKSSRSCVCIPLLDCPVAIDDTVVFIYKKTRQIKEAREDKPATLSSQSDSTRMLIEENGVSVTQKKSKEYIRARISAASYSSMSNEEGRDRHRALMRLSLNAHNINNSNFSLETYLNYRKNFIQKELPPNYKTSFFNIYNLALTYDVDSTVAISLGRKINRRISSIGPIDGIQISKSHRNFYAGGVAGFKPDFSGFDLNTNLYEYGAYIGHQSSSPSLTLMTTIGALVQHNRGPVDRSYVYLQHSSSIKRKLNFFTSLELDVYDNGASNGSPRLTNLYISTRYRMSRKVSLFLSFDSRRRIIYYESFKSEVERLLEEDQQRRGFRARINIRPIKYVNTSLSFGKRFQNDKRNKSENINASISHSKIPIVSGRMALAYNSNASNYYNSRIISLRYSRPLIKRKLNGDFYYRNVKYTYGSSEFQRELSYYGANLSLTLTKTLRFSLLGEISLRDEQRNYRVNTKLIKRFKTKT